MQKALLLLILIDDSLLSHHVGFSFHDVEAHVLSTYTYLLFLYACKSLLLYISYGQSKPYWTPAIFCKHFIEFQ